ncbi:hypothetical protein AVEN_272245-1 [Araneus ventricosus]|uniref:Uncharacterized protein n=1 Tax=Araneus ventricosus TaxID=182803 RepID=A0A4Y2J472_ARAVE|nr:hypothetical protein AVEN_272245-1 [Araneus ventricosus]
METGGYLKYLLEITLPQTDGMDLTIEFFTKEIGNGNYTPVLAVFNVEILEKPDGVSFSRGDQPHIEMLLSDEIMTAVKINFSSWFQAVSSLDMSDSLEESFSGREGNEFEVFLKRTVFLIP